MKSVFRDPQGDTKYASDSFDFDPLVYGRLGRTHEDLQKYKQRIDANVENQREYSELMHAMQQKVCFS